MTRMAPSRLKRDRRGQFIIIAAILIAILIVSVASVMYGAVTYFRHERWEEYLTVIDTVRASSNRLVEISLANYTLTGNQTVLKANLDRWQRDLMKTYTGLGVVLASSLASGAQEVYGVTIQYDMGLAKDWNRQESFSAANVTFTLNITSVGLHGYKFVTPVFLKMNITDALYYQSSEEVGVRLVVHREDLIPIINLEAANFIEFKIDGDNKSFSFYRYFDSQTLNAFVYELRCGSQTQPSNITAFISVVDSRGVKVTGNATLSVTQAD